MFRQTPIFQPHLWIPSKLVQGTIDLLEDVSSSDLEAYLENGALNLGININENSKMQGIAIRDLELVLQTREGVMTFDNFHTNTSASTLESGSQTAQTFFTVLGRTGSSGINGSGFSNTDDVIYLSGIN